MTDFEESRSGYLIKLFLGPKNSFIKYPERLSSKSVTLKILPDIQPGLSKKEFLSKLETEIENASNELIKKELS